MEYLNEELDNIELVDKVKAVNNIIKFVNKNIKSKNLGYYIKNPSISISEYIYDPADIELLGLLSSHMDIAIRCMGYLANTNSNSNTNTNSNELYKITGKIKVAFIKDGFFFDDIFALNNIIYIKYSRLIDIFIESDNIYFLKNKVIPTYMFEYNDEILDKKLLIDLTRSLLYYSQYLNLSTWISYIQSKYDCAFMYKDNFELFYSMNLIKNKVNNPNIAFINDYRIIYKVDSEKYIVETIFDTKKIDYAPYYVDKYYKLTAGNIEYIEYIEYITNIPNINIIDENPFIKEVNNCIKDIFNMFL